MTQVLLFVEHELREDEVARTLEALAELRVGAEDQVDVTVLVPWTGHWPVPLMDDLAAAHGSSVSRAIEDARLDANISAASARRILRHALAAVRKAGHSARGELVVRRAAVRELAAEAAARHATTALVVSSPHRLSHLVHRDLERRLNRAGIARVIPLKEMRATAAFS